MRSRSRVWMVLAGGVTVAALAVGVLPAMAGAAAGPYCGITWGSLEKRAPSATSAPITGVRVGRHDCYDRLVVDLAGKPAGGYNVRYIDPPFRAEGSGAPLLVAGGAVLQVTALAPAYDGYGNWTAPWSSTAVVIRPDQFQAGGFRTFRDLVWGGSFEGYSSFGLGVRARLPFQVLLLDGPGGGSRMAIDVAHQW